MLIENNLLNFENFIINIESKTISIENCKIDIVLKIQSKSSYMKKVVHAQYEIVLQLNEEQLMTIKTEIFEKRDFYFKSDSNVNFTMYLHLLKIDNKKILIKNETKHILKLSKRRRLNQILELNCDNCF